MNPQLFEHITALLSEYLDKASRAVMDVPEQPTLQYILAQVQKIAADTEYITQAIQPLTETKSHGIGIGAGNIIEIWGEERYEKTHTVSSYADKLKALAQYGI